MIDRADDAPAEVRERLAAFEKFQTQRAGERNSGTLRTALGHHHTDGPVTEFVTSTVKTSVTPRPIRSLTTPGMR